MEAQATNNSNQTASWPSLLLLLKSRTQAIHTHIEQTSPLNRLIHGHGTTQNYIQILQALAPLYVTLETSEEIRRWAAEHHPPFLRHSRLACIRQELGDYPLPAQSHVPPWADWSEVSAVIGTLYVIEGATLGGKLIAKSLCRHYGLDIIPGQSLFDPYGKDCAQYWKDFAGAVGRMQGFVHQDTAIAAALATFHVYEECLSHVHDS